MTQANPVTDLMRIVGRLIGVLEREIELLRAMKPSDLQGLQQDKLALTAAYEAQIKAFKERPDLLESLVPAVRVEMRAALDRLQKTLAENETSLRAARQTTQRVLQAIADEVARTRRKNAAYGADGSAGCGPRSAPRDPVSVAYDQRL